MIQRQPLSLPNCIRCLVSAADAQSHIVPNSIRLRLYGTLSTPGRQFAFSYIGRPDLPKQDFPKPHLMCITCDNKFGSDVEAKLPALLMPADVDDPAGWEGLGLINLAHGPFKAYPPAAQPLITLNAALIAWKVLHAVARDGRHPELSTFLQTAGGKALDHAMLHFIIQQPPAVPVVRLNAPVFWKIPPETAAALTGKDDELPICWAVQYEQGKPEAASIFALFGFWVVAWQLPGCTWKLSGALSNWLMVQRKTFCQRDI